MHFPNNRIWQSVAGALRTLVCFCSTTALILSGWTLLEPRSIAQTTQFDEAAERELVNLINQSRQEQGLALLEVDPRLTAAARKHTALMVARKPLSHQYEGEESLQVRISDENVRSDREGENIALDSNVAMAHQALMRSPGHRANILDPEFNAVGVGIIAIGHDVYVTEDFAHRLPDYSDQQASFALRKTIENYVRSKGVPPPPTKPQASLHKIACDMALNDALDTETPTRVPGVRGVFEWTAGDLNTLPPKAKGLLTQPLPLGYSLGVCYAPSVSHPGGIYWVVMVTY